MANRVSKEVPIAKRIVDFEKDDFKEVGPLDALVLVDGRDIVRYGSEYPIVMYQCDESQCYADIMPEPRLNAFILNITVSTGVDGKRYSVSSAIMEEEPAEFDTIAYYEDPVGIKHQIIRHDICRFLLKKPQLVVSEEGVLVFFTEEEILATVDCQKYAWLRWDDVIKNCTSIANIFAYKEYCEVLLVEGEDIYDDFGNVKKLAPRHDLALNFDLKVSDHNMIKPKFGKIKS